MGAQQGARRDEGEVEVGERDARTCLCVVSQLVFGKSEAGQEQPPSQKGKFLSSFARYER